MRSRTAASTQADAVVAYGEEGDTVVAFSPDQLATLTKVVLEYTRELVKVNHIELDNEETSNMQAEGGTVVGLRMQLEAQRRTFRNAA